MSHGEAYLASLRESDWFASVGNPIHVDNPQLKQVNSWSEATEWTTHPVSQWCSLEAGKYLYEGLAEVNRELFNDWNQVARRLLPQIEDLLDKKIVPRIPTEFVSDDVVGWIQSQLIGAATELEYRDVIEVGLLEEQMKLYTVGRFPCGWYVAGPDDFPESAVTFIF